MASNRDLFGDDDSDDEDVAMEETDNNYTPAAAATEGAATLDTPMDDTNNTNANTVNIPTNSTKGNNYMNQNHNDDSDDDDDDDDDDAPQFDDQDVVGTKSTQPTALPLFGTTTNNNSSSNNNNNSDSSHENVAATANVLPVRPTLVVPDGFRHFPSNVRHVETTKYFTKLPNLMGIQTTPFSEDTYDPEMEQELYQQASYHLIRWRYKTDPVTKQPLRRDQTSEAKEEQQEKEEEDGSSLSLLRDSNTRLVEWEDGSHTLHVGSECFHIDLVDSSTGGSHTIPAPSFPGLNGYLYMSQNAAYQKKDIDNNGGGESTGPLVNHSNTKKETILQCMGPIRQRMVIRPSSLQSDAHKSLTVGIRQKTIKKARIAEVVTQEDPELIKQQKMKLSQDIEKTNLRKRAGLGMYNNPSRGSGGSRPRLSKDYLEEDDDYDTTNLKDMKRRTMNRYDDDDDDDGDMGDYGDDDDDDDDDEDITLRNKGRPSRRGVLGSGTDPASTTATTTTTTAKHDKTLSKNDDNDDNDDVFGNDNDDEDEDDAIPTKTSTTRSKKTKKLHQAVIDDDDDDDE